MKHLLALLGIAVAVVLPSSDARAAEHPHVAPASSPSSPSSPSFEEDSAAGPTTPAGEAGPKKPGLDFDFFAEPESKQVAGGANLGMQLDVADTETTSQAHTRRWMLRTHQVLGPITWALLTATTIVGQLHYNRLYGDGDGSLKYQGAHRALIVSTGVAFVATGTFALLAPTPFKKPLRLDTGLIHRIAVSAATLGMITQMVLGWVTTHRANAGNSNGLDTLARTHQVVGYTTLGCLTVAGAVWVF